MELRVSNSKRIFPVVLETGRLNFKDSVKVVHGFIASRMEKVNWNRPLFQDIGQGEIPLLASLNPDDIVVVFRDTSPWIDWEEVEAAASWALRSGAEAVRIDGLVPGSDPVVLARARGASTSIADLAGAATVYRSFRQDRYNNQLNLFKNKRLKMFLSLVRGGVDPGITIPGLMDYLGDDGRHDQLVGFSSGAPMLKYDRCPHCGGELCALPPAMSQPFCGYVLASKPYYHECRGCGLIVLSPRVAPEHVHEIYDVFDRQDFVVSLNNPYVDGNPRCDLSAFVSGFSSGARVLDLGGGVGKFSMYLKGRYPGWDVVHSDFEFKKNPDLERIGVETRGINFLSEEIGESEFDMITAWEVLEHVPYEFLDKVLARVHRALRPGGFFVFSTPDFDSPLCRSFDFYNACPPFHYTVFGRRWLDRYFSGRSEWRKLPDRWCSDFLDDAIMWFEYAAATAPSFQQRGLAQVLKSIFQADNAASVKRALLGRGMGTEIIVTLQKNGKG